MIGVERHSGAPAPDCCAVSSVHATIPPPHSADEQVAHCPVAGAQRGADLGAALARAAP